MMPIETVPDPFMKGLEMAALSIHKALRGMPVAMKARHRAGIIIEGGEFHAAGRESHALDHVSPGKDVQQIYISEGRHAGAIMFASAIVDDHGHSLAAIGVIDTYGVLSLGEFLANSDHVEQQVYGRRPRRR